MADGWLQHALRRTVGILAMLLGVLGLLVSGVIIVGCWWFLSSVSQRTSQALERVERIFDVTSESFAQVQASLHQADKELQAVREAERTPSASKSRQPQLGKAASRRLASKLTSSLGDTQRSVRVAVEAAVVANSLLEGLDEVPLVRLSKLDTEQLHEVNDRVSALTRRAQQLEALLETPSKSGEVDEETSRMRQILSQVTVALQRLADRMDGVRGRVAELRSRIAGWLLVTAVGLTVIWLWIGIGQWSLLAHGWSWCRTASARQL
jgi:hypothetical protein